MSNILIKKEYLNKVKLLNKYNKFYYDKSNPVVSDQEYDDLKLNILKIEKNYPTFIDGESLFIKFG
jgi:DNA ligase (NAD+)